MSPRLAMVAVVGVLLGGAAAWVIGLRNEPLSPATSRQVGKAQIGGPFSLTDHRGRRVTEKDFRGGKTLVYFGFTTCPDVCPTGLQVITAALEALGAKAAGVTPIFISVDPERDTPEKMAEYVRSFHPRLIGLTGSPEDVAAAAKVFRVYFKKVPDGKTPGEYSVDHSSIVYLMDENGEFVRHFNHPTDPAKLAQELAKSL